MNFKKDNRGIAKSALVVIIVLIGAIIIGGAIFASSMLKKDPFTRLMLGYMKAYENSSGCIFFYGQGECRSKETFRTDSGRFI